MLAEHLKTGQIQPQLVLCSSSCRTRETLEGIGLGGQHLIETELYGARTEELLARLRRIPDEVESVMVIGHNPTMQTVVLRLASAALSMEPSTLSAVRAKFPTGALATLTVECPWSELAPGCAGLAGFVRPKALVRS